MPPLVLADVRDCVANAVFDVADIVVTPTLFGDLLVPKSGVMLDFGVLLFVVAVTELVMLFVKLVAVEPGSELVIEYGDICVLVDFIELCIDFFISVVCSMRVEVEDQDVADNVDEASNVMLLGEDEDVEVPIVEVERMWSVVIACVESDAVVDACL